MKVKFLNTALAGLILAVSFMVNVANAGLITNEIADADSFIDFSQFSNFSSSGPIDIDNDPSKSVIWSTSHSRSGFSWSSYGLASNGSWNNSSMNGYVGLNTDNGWMQFSFIDGPVSEFSIFTNYARCGSDPYDNCFGNMIIQAYDINNGLLESHNINTSAPIVTASNSGAYRGIARTQNDISYFRLNGSV
jgi:hypothetical protein